MEFLYKLYSNDFFGIGLFIVITILTFSFLVILFFGKKDEKERNKEIESSVENNENRIETHENEEMLKADALETVNLPVENNSAVEMKEESSLESTPIETEPFVSSNMVLNSDLVGEENKEEISTVIEQELPQQNAEENIVNEISVETPVDVEENKQEESVLETPIEEEITIDPFDIDNQPVSSLETPVISEPVQNDIFSEVTEKKEETPKKVVMPTQFSSVYLTKEKEETPVVVEEKEEEITPIPLKPNFDLPKPLDLPKLNKDSGVSEGSNDNIIKPLNDANGSLSNIFDNIEEDTYTINK